MTAVSRFVNLAHRAGDGISVSLDYDRKETQCIVRVKSDSSDFALYPPNCKALDCYYHPFAYADSVLKRGTFAEVS